MTGARTIRFPTSDAQFVTHTVGEPRAWEMAGVIAAARETGVKAVAACGRSTLGAEGAKRLGVGRVYRLTDLEPNPGRCVQDAEHLLRVIGRTMAQEWLLSSQGAGSSDPTWR